MKLFVARICLAAFVILPPVQLGAQAQNPRSIGESRDRSKEFVGWVQPERLYWRPFVISGVPDGVFELLSFDESTHARSQITRLPPGWTQPKGYHTTNMEMFVLDGEIEVADDYMTKYSYVYIPAGYAHGPIYSETGVTLLQWWDADPDFVTSELSKPEARLDEVVQHWNFYTAPWTKAEDFPKFSDRTPSRELRLKLLRKDKVTGQMTWINEGAPGGLRSKTPWEAHPSWEEAMLLEGSFTYGECLPEGEVVGPYTAGGYFFRPPNILHGGRSAYSNTYTLWIFRSGHQLWADYFEACQNPPQKAGAARGGESK